MKLSFTALPGVDFWGLSTTVHDETEIGHAVSELRRRLPLADGELVLLYDGTRDDQITVSAGTMSQSESGAVSRIVTPGAAEGVTVTFDVPPESIAEAWILIDAELEKQDLTSFGVYRQLNSVTGHVTLQAPVRERG